MRGNCVRLSYVKVESVCLPWPTICTQSHSLYNLTLCRGVWGKHLACEGLWGLSGSHRKAPCYHVIGSICHLAAHCVQAKSKDSDGELTHVQLNALLGVLKRHVTSFWPCKRRSNLDARVVKRLTGQDKFVDFEGSDPAARGMLIRGLHDMHGTLQHRYKELLVSSTATADSTWNKWVLQEREMTWRALALTSRGLHAWGTVLYSQLHGLLVERTPGTSLMMLKAVRPISVQPATVPYITFDSMCTGFMKHP